jgi:hypothetical protein
MGGKRFGTSFVPSAAAAAAAAAAGYYALKAGANVLGGGPSALAGGLAGGEAAQLRLPSVQRGRILENDPVTRRAIREWQRKHPARPDPRRLPPAPERQRRPTVRPSRGVEAVHLVPIEVKIEGKQVARAKSQAHGRRHPRPEVPMAKKSHLVGHQGQGQGEPAVQPAPRSRRSRSPATAAAARRSRSGSRCCRPTATTTCRCCARSRATRASSAATAAGKRSSAAAPSR